MIALIQRVTEARVTVEGRTIGEIGPGLLALIGVQRLDDAASAERLLERVLTYRVFPDGDGRMNLSLKDTGGGLLLVSQFTLAADTRTGTRAGFTTAAAPELARELFEQLVSLARARHPTVATGEFRAHMRVSLVNDGPVTFWLSTTSRES
ncbi:MAG TPA: D-aminoacyl-tRNA deacylase [Steroidobacteraceae bacterium]|nr:D-aminoacyl-tRNA deacylase [Steroidobacteraceae bacterium]